MKFSYTKLDGTLHRLIPSRFPTVNLFDWAESAEELVEVANLEGLTNDRLVAEYGQIHAVNQEDWVSGEGATALMSTFTHPGISRFSDGSFGIYYAADSLQAAVAETCYHRERFLKASNEAPCIVQMREYKCKVVQPLVSILSNKYKKYLDPDPGKYPISQQFGQEIKTHKEWGLLYKSVRKSNAKCIAIFRPPAVTMPVQGCHFDYTWDGQTISVIKKLQYVIQ